MKRKRMINEISIKLYDDVYPMIITLLLGGGFTTIIGVAILTLSLAHSFWNEWLKRRANVKQSEIKYWDILHY